MTSDAALLADTVREAGALALSLFRTDLKTWTKGASSPVSEADITVNDLIEARLAGARPDYGWLSEESAENAARLERPFTWVVDPIDGTRAYLNHQHDWSVSVALVQDDGRPVLGAVFAPADQQFYFATRNGGATLNDAVTRVAAGSALDLARMAGPKPLVERLESAATGTASHPRIGSLALRLCRVADGGIDAAFAGGRSRDWDLAAADLIVHEAGGKMTALTGEPLVYNRADVTHGLLVAAGHDRHQRIVDHFRSHPVF